MSRWAALLAGGTGTRFWPLSTATRPKQLLALVGETPLLAQTAARLEPLVPLERTLVITGKGLAAQTRQVLSALPPENLLAEPRAASTAPALAWATWVARERDPSATILSLHADWYVGDDALFRATATQAMDVAERHDRLVAVGVVPTRAEIGYGYIELGEPLDADAHAVLRFTEKPDAERAAALVAGGALWNSGLFAWTAERFLAETEAVAPELAPHLTRLRDDDIEGFFANVTPIAVDVSHFERGGRVACVTGRFPWDDVGTWTALERVRATDDRANVVVGDAFVHEAAGCVVWADDGAVVVDGIENAVVIRANGVTLVTSRDRAAQLKELLEALPPEIRSRPT